MYGVHQIRCIPGLEREASYTQCFIKHYGMDKVQQQIISVTHIPSSEPWRDPTMTQNVTITFPECHHSICNCGRTQQLLLPTAQQWP